MPSWNREEAQYFLDFELWTYIKLILDWGKLSNTGNNAMVSGFINNMEDFTKLLASAKSNLSGT